MTETYLDWRQLAACEPGDGEVLFPGRGESPAAARRLCRGCPVRIECLDWALETDERFGIWGGLSPGERDRIQSEGRSAADAVRAARDNEPYRPSSQAAAPGQPEMSVTIARDRRRRASRRRLDPGTTPPAPFRGCRDLLRVRPRLPLAFVFPAGRGRNPVT